MGIRHLLSLKRVVFQSSPRYKSNAPGISHYRKLDLCRVRRGLPSGKNRALGRGTLPSAKPSTRQRTICRVPDSRQTQALDKEVLCRVPGSWQTWALGKECQGANGIHGRHLCRVPAVRHSAKSCHVAGSGATRPAGFCRVPCGRHSANDLFAECQP